MKALFITLLTVIAATATAKSLEVTIPNVRSDKGKILVMVQSADSEKPVYAMTEAKVDSVSVRIEGLTATDASISIFHDEDDDYQMKMDDGRPQEDYARTSCPLNEKQDAIVLPLTYPVNEKQK